MDEVYIGANWQIRLNDQNGGDADCRYRNCSDLF